MRKHCGQPWKQGWPQARAALPSIDPLENGNGFAVGKAGWLYGKISLHRGKTQLRTVIVFWGWDYYPSGNFCRQYALEYRHHHCVTSTAALCLTAPPRCKAPHSRSPPRKYAIWIIGAAFASDCSSQMTIASNNECCLSRNQIRHLAHTAIKRAISWMPRL